MQHMKDFKIIILFNQFISCYFTLMNLKDYIRSIPDYPKKGILFRDITTLIKDMNLTSVTQTFVIPGIGTTALSTKVPDFNSFYAKATATEQKIVTMEQKLQLLKQN